MEARWTLNPAARQLSIPVLSYSDCPALQTTFTPLPQWEREYALFWQLIAIPLFRQHCVWKQFARWKKAVRNRVMEVGRWVLQDGHCLDGAGGVDVKDQKCLLHGAGVWVRRTRDIPCMPVHQGLSIPGTAAMHDQPAFS